MPIAGRAMLGPDIYDAPASETQDPQSSFSILDPTREINHSGAVRGPNVGAGAMTFHAEPAGGIAAPDGHAADGNPGYERSAAFTISPWNPIRTQATGGHVVIRRVVPGSSRGQLTPAPLQPNVRRNAAAPWDQDVAIG